MRRLFLRWLAGPILALLGVAAAAMTPSGTGIHNRADAHFLDARSGLHAMVASNAVMTTVSPFEAVALLPDSRIRSAPGAMVEILQRIDNNGNADGRFALTIAAADGDDRGLRDLTITRDLNGNGRADSGEPQLAAGQVIELAAGAGADLVITARVAAQISGAAMDLLLVARGERDGVTALARHRIEVADGPAFKLDKQASVASAEGGDRLSFLFTAVNRGSAASGLPVMVDGRTESLVLLRDALPANTRLEQISKPANGLALYHWRSDPPQAWRSMPAEDLSVVDAVAWAWPGFDARGAAQVMLTLRVADNAAGVLLNTATLHFGDPAIAGPALRVDSNTARIGLPDTAPSLRFTDGPQSDTEISAASRGSTAYLLLDAAACNLVAGRPDTVTLQIDARDSGDLEAVRAVETAPNSGRFRASLPTADAAALRGDGSLQLLVDDEINASALGCASSAVDAQVGVDPLGVVFDSKTNVPVAGARVTLIDHTGAGNGGRAGEAAVVFDIDGSSPRPSTVVTGADGVFEFPIVRPSLYRLLVEPPASHRFASILPPALLPADREILADGSYGRPFEVSFETGAVTIDVPVDARPEGGLLLDKRASRAQAEIGDFVDYRLRLRNISGAPLGDIVVDDRLPAGFVFVPGSLRIGDAPADPASSSGGRLLIGGIDLADQAGVEIGYRLHIGPAALAGDGVNRARAHSAAPLVRSSNTATARVAVSGGVFSRRALVLGKVFADCNRNRLQDAGEPGIPGLRIVMDNGRQVVTDALGSYHFSEVSPRTHVARLDHTSLPAGAAPLALDSRNAGDAGSRFIDLRPGELHRADFALGGCDAILFEQIEARRKLLETGVRDDDDLDPLALSVSTAGDRRSLPASRPAQIPVGDDEPPAPAPPGGAAAADPLPESALPTLEVLLPVLDSTAAIVGLSDGQLLERAQSDIRIKGPAALKLRLELNGESVGDDRIGHAIVDTARGIQLLEYVGVRFAAGSNVLTLRGVDSFGVDRVNQQMALRLPGAAAQLRIQVANDTLPADGADVDVRISLHDAAGLRIGEPSAISLLGDRARWLAADSDAISDGVQTELAGEQRFRLRAPVRPGDVVVEVRAGSLRASRRLHFVAAPRPLIAAGVIEAAIGKSSGDAGLSTFERELDGLGRLADAGSGVRSGARASVFAKGEIGKGRQLTLGYDSAGHDDARQFADRRSDRAYPVHGDNSIAGYDAQSSGKLYLRVDQGQSHLLWGDFVTPRARGSRRLGAYGRSLNGLSGRHVDGGLRVDGFLSRAESRLVVSEIAADGTSGPFQLDLGGIVPGSERIEVLVRDREQRERILSERLLRSPADYEIDDIDGSLLLRAPLPGLDGDLNPVSLRLRYEVAQDGPSHWVGGASADYALTSALTVGAGLVVDRDPAAGMRLAHAHASWQISEQTMLRAEVAGLARDGEDASRGSAARIEIEHRDDKVDLKAFAARTGRGFDNPSADLGRGREEAGARLAWRVRPDTRVLADARHTADLADGSEHQRVRIGVERSLSGQRQVEIGLRADRARGPASSDGDDADVRHDLRVRARIQGPLPAALPGTTFIEAEQSVRERSQRLLAVGGDLRLGNGLRAYGRHELLSSTRSFGRFGGGDRHSTLLGVDTRGLGAGRSYSEYRVRDAIDGRVAEAAVGLRRGWDLFAGDGSRGLRLSAAFERVKTLSGVDSAQAGHTTLALAADHRGSPLWKGSTRLERRIGQGGAGSWLWTASGSRRFGPNWATLGKLLWHRQTVAGDSTQPRLRQRLRIGVAYRDAATNRSNALARYELRRDSQGASRLRTQLLSAHADRQLGAGLVASGVTAVKWVDDARLGLRSRSRTALLGARIRWDLADRWDLSLSASRLFDGLGGSRHGLGAELGYRVDDNLWLAAGIVRAGLRDNDLGDRSWSGDGAYLRLRFKFDERLFDSSEGER